jgi:hypothetical protein
MYEKQRCGLAYHQTAAYYDFKAFVVNAHFVVIPLVSHGLVGSGVCVVTDSHRACHQTHCQV